MPRGDLAVEENNHLNFAHIRVSQTHSSGDCATSHACPYLELNLLLQEIAVTLT